MRTIITDDAVEVHFGLRLLDGAADCLTAAPSSSLLSMLCV